MIRPLHELRTLRGLVPGALEPAPLPRRLTTGLRTIAVILATSLVLALFGDRLPRHWQDERWVLPMVVVLPILGVTELILHRIAEHRDRRRIVFDLPVRVDLPGWRAWAHDEALLVLVRNTCLVCLFRHPARALEDALDRVDPERVLETVEETDGRLDVELERPDEAPVHGFVRRLVGTDTFAVVLADDTDALAHADAYLRRTLIRLDHQPQQQFRVPAPPEVAAARYNPRR
jgi:hypothetical protein